MDEGLNLAIAAIVAVSLTIGVSACEPRPLPPEPEGPGRVFISPPMMSLADTADDGQLNAIENAVEGIREGVSEECDDAKAWMLSWIQDHRDWLNSNGASGQVRFVVTSGGNLATTEYSGSHPHSSNDWYHTNVDECVFNENCDCEFHGLTGPEGLFAHEGMHPSLDMHMGADEEQLQEWDNDCEPET